MGRSTKVITEKSLVTQTPKSEFSWRVSSMFTNFNNIMTVHYVHTKAKNQSISSWSLKKTEITQFLCVTIGFYSLLHFWCCHKPSKSPVSAPHVHSDPRMIGLRRQELLLKVTAASCHAHTHLFFIFLDKMSNVKQFDFVVDSVYMIYPESFS